MKSHTVPPAATFFSLALLSAVAFGCTAAPAQSGVPAAAPAAKSAVVPATPTPAPPPSSPPPADAAELTKFFDGYFPSGTGETKFQLDVTAPIPGYRLLLVTKSFVEPANFADRCAAYLDNAGTHALIGTLFVDTDRTAQPVQSDGDLASMRTLMQEKVFVGMRHSVALDPSLDIPGWKGLKITLQTGYGGYPLPAYVSAADGRRILLGRRWERNRPVPAQRRQLIQLQETPFDGANDGAIEVVEYSDMQCPSCKKRTADWTIVAGKLASSLKIRRFVKSYPLTDAHPWAFRAASAGRCLFQKDPALFFRWKGSVYNRQEQMDVASLDSFALDFAESSGFTESEFQACYLSPRISERILSDLAEGFVAGVRSTPTYIVDGVLVNWFKDDSMEEYLRKTYLKGAGLPLPKTSVSKNPGAVAPSH